jgi:hypothetical protein
MICCKDKKVRASDVAQKKEKKADAQLDAQTVATWQFLGAKTDQLWLLVRHTLLYSLLH